MTTAVIPSGALSPSDLSKFGTVGLDELNRRAALLDRMENKYIVAVPALVRILDELAHHFDVLAIDGAVVFRYDTIYFDSDDRVSYRDHAQGKRRRFKIRTRRYVDSDQCFFEVKLKGVRGRTIKERIPYNPSQRHTVNGDARAFLSECFRKVYGTEFSHDVAPSLPMRYRRVTLVGKRAAERVTIDFALEFQRDERTWYPAPPEFAIVEVKSERGRGLADKVFRHHGLRGTACSKYCVGLNVMQPDLRYNAFKHVLETYFGWTPRHAPGPGHLTPALERAS
jgi:hypothetical protein